MSSFVKKDHVGSLPAFAWSYVAWRLSPYPAHYRPAFAFSHVPLPAPPSVRLAARLPLAGRRYGLTLFQIENTKGLGSALTPVVINVEVSLTQQGRAGPHTFWFRPVSIFGLFMLTVRIQQFTYVNHTFQPSHLTALMLAVIRRSLAGSAQVSKN